MRLHIGRRRVSTDSRHLHQRRADCCSGRKSNKFSVAGTTKGVRDYHQRSRHVPWFADRAASNGAIFLHQEAYTNRVLERFRMETANPVAIPADKQHETYEAAHSGSKEAVNVSYRQAIGCLMYLSVATRPLHMQSIKPVSSSSNPRKRIGTHSSGSSSTARVHHIMDCTTKVGATPKSSLTATPTMLGTWRLQQDTS